ncbi:hypothetical protein HY251_04570 [bacterium]|nr:hypothetical protein [bacterium]
MRPKRVLLSFAVVAAFATLVLGCPAKKRPGTTKILENPPVPIGQDGLPAGHPPVEGAPFAPFAQGQGGEVEQGVELPLKQKGLSSKTQLESELAKLDDEASKKAFERAFRLAFTTKKESRKPAEAQALLDGVLQKRRTFAPAYRVLAYIAIDQGGGFDRAIDFYKLAIEADPSYGPAHYGLAFMLGATANGDRAVLEEGRAHWKKALELGVEDERDLRRQFYSGS